MNNLNKEQLLAVEHYTGPLLIVAGAGSGKTRVITYRIANLIREYKINPYNILAVTFTNKAALEMKLRVQKILGLNGFNLWVRTFHSLCATILRIEADTLKFDRNFTIIDDNDKIGIIKDVMKEIGIDKENFPPDIVSQFISAKKNRMNFEGDANMDIMKKIMVGYNNYKSKYLLFDFDDLILEVINIFENNSYIVDKYRSKFKFILVDEFQDTNFNQYKLLYLLGREHRNINVVGDEDQAIYSWRGGDIENFFRFRNDFKGTKIIKLEQNYRSTKNILKVANFIISQNRHRDKKLLWTNNPAGSEIIIENFFSGYEEAEFITDTIKEYIISGKYKYRDIAVFMRTNYYTSNFDIIFNENNIPYKVFGGTKLFDKKEIKDIIAYLRFFNNPKDIYSFFRIINTPNRGIGLVAVNKIKSFMAKNNLSIYDVPEHFKTNKNIKIFYNVLNDIRKRKDKLGLSDFVKYIIKQIGYKEYLNKYDNAKIRKNNIRILEDDVKKYEKEEENANLTNYIERISLMTNIDEYEKNKNYVSVMTLHNAKGLEFKVVFMVGLVEGVFPHIKVLREAENKPDKIEEERRLFYVGVTRAKEELILTYTNIFKSYSREFPVNPSRFLDGIGY